MSRQRSLTGACAPRCAPFLGLHRFTGAHLPLLVALLLAAGPAAAVQINEIRTDHGGTDTDEYFELSGTPGQILTGQTYLVIGDGAGACGVIESVTDLAPFSIQADGLLCLRNSLAVPVLLGYDGAVPLAFENSDNVTHMLVSGFTGAIGQDLDTNDDGVLDVTPWSAVLDCVGLDEGTVPNCALTDEYLYCATRVGPDSVFVPGGGAGARRCAQGLAAKGIAPCPNRDSERGTFPAFSLRGCPGFAANPLTAMESDEDRHTGNGPLPC